MSDGSSVRDRLHPLPDLVHCVIASHLGAPDVFRLAQTARWAFATYVATVRALSLRCPYENSSTAREAKEHDARDRRATVLSLLSRPMPVLRTLTAMDPWAFSGVAHALAAGRCRDIRVLRFVGVAATVGYYVQESDVRTLAAAIEGGAVPSLTTLELSQIEAKSGGMKHIIRALASGACPSLTDLDPGLSGYESDVTALAMALGERGKRGLPPLRKLAVNFSLFTWEGLWDVLQADACRELEELQVAVSLEGGMMDGVGLDALAQYLRGDRAGRLKSLMLRADGTGAVAFPAALAHGAAPSLEVLCLDFVCLSASVCGLCTGLARGGWPHLRTLRLCNSDDLRPSHIDMLMRAILAAPPHGPLSGRPALRELSVSGNPLGPSGARCIAGRLLSGACRGLEELHMAKCDMGPEGARKILSALADGAMCADSIKRLVFDVGLDASEEDIAPLMRACPRLTHGGLKL